MTLDIPVHPKADAGLARDIPHALHGWRIGRVGLAALLAASLARAANPPAPAPVTLVAPPGRALFFASPRAPEKSNDPRQIRLAMHQPLPASVRLDPRRGSIVVRLTPTGPFGGFPSVFDIYPGPPHATLRVTAAWPKPKNGEPPPEKKILRAAVEAVLRHAHDGNALDAVKAENDLEPGQDLHVVWTWSGVRHCLYLNGKLVTARIADSPFPPEFKPVARLLSNYSQELLAAAPVYELAGYDFAMTPEEVAQDFAGKDDAPLAPAAAHGPTVVAQWAPGEKKAYVALDTGNDFAGRAERARIVLHCDAATVATTELRVAADGFAETLLPIGDMPAGKYVAEIALLDAAGKSVGTATSEAWTLPPTPWLGNRLGLSNEVQPPWTPIRSQGGKLMVWGREYDLHDGFGLPQQITSQGRDLLAAPVTLELVRDGQPVPLTEQHKINAVNPSFATWSGRAMAGDVAVTLHGRLEYDGMVLLNLTLAPRTPGTPVRLDAIRLDTVMPKERALFLNTTTDQGYWWYSYKAWVPEGTGVVHDNLKQRQGRTPLLFFVLFSDYDTGLEWFADNLSGWQIDETKPIQEIIREANGDVRLRCHLANRPFELREPLTITFGYDATPVKPLPPDWRDLYVHHNPLPGLQNDLAMWWLWSDSRYDKFRPNVFLLRPDDLAGFATTRQAGKRVHDVRLAPFTNQHVTLPTAPENQAPDKGWGWFNNLLQAESANDGWTAIPTRGIRDYWAWNLDQWLASGGLDAIYIDEANTQTISASLLTGSGYVRPDGTHGFGHNTLGMREQLKRVRQLFLDHGKRTPVWIPTYGMTMPHAFAFVDVVSEGEAFMFDKPDQPDWIDVWGADFLNRTPGPGARGGPWLLSLGPAQKFGFIPVFLNYIKFYDKPEYLPAMHAQYALLGLLDIIPVSPELAWVFKAKHDFGMGAPETSFHAYHEQQEVRADRDDVKISYYRRGENVLCWITNLGKTPYTGTIALDLPKLGLAPDKLAAAALEPVKEARMSTEYKAAPVPWEPGGPTLRVSVPAHDFRMLRLQRIRGDK